MLILSGVQFTGLGQISEPQVITGTVCAIGEHKATRPSFLKWFLQLSDAVDLEELMPAFSHKGIIFRSTQYKTTKALL